MRTSARHRLRTILRCGVPAAFAIVVTLADAACALTLGAVAPPGLGGCGNCNVFQRQDGSGPSYRVPAGKWTITSWSAQGGGSESGKARLRVYRRTQVGQFKVVQQSRRKVVPANGSPSFPVSLAVRGGDRIGIETVRNLVSAYGVSNGAKTATVPCSVVRGQLVGAGTSCALGKLGNEQVNVAVELAPR